MYLHIMTTYYNYRNYSLFFTDCVCTTKGLRFTAVSEVMYAIF